MATSTKANRKRNKKQSSRRYVGKPSGIIQPRVAEVGPEHFAVLSVDCAKRRSKWMLCDFLGRVLVEPTDVEHRNADLRSMAQHVLAACEAEGIKDIVAGVEMTGTFHRPVIAALKKHDIDARIVHPFASSHFRRALHPNQKTDNKDLEAIFHAVCNGYGLALLSADPVYKQLQSVVRHRRNLVKQRARRQTQIRGLMHQCMPGYADVFSDDKFFGKSIAIPVATHFQTAAAIDAAGPQQIAQTLRENKVRFQQRTIDRIVAWSRTAAEPEANHEMLGEQWMDLLQLYRMHSKMIEAAKQKSAHLLVKTPYILLLSVTGINVVSAAELAGEAGPIEHYASVAALNGRAGLYPSRYQSDEVDRSGTMAKNWNRRLRAACLMVARNLIKCHSYYRGMAGLMKHEKVHGRDRECRVANRANRMVFQLVSGRQVWRGKGVDREYLLKKLQTFHHDHKTPLQQIAADLITAADWLPKTTHLEEGQQIAVPKTTRSKNIKTMGELLLPLMIRLGVEDPDRLESDTSEA